MVRLRFSFGLLSFDPFLLFQFLYGAIKVGASKATVTDLKIFQFLYGAIKVRLVSYRFFCCLDFNSCMVRLRSSHLPLMAH